MKEELDNYFSGRLSKQEKGELFDKIESDAESKKEFFRMQHTVSLSKLYPQNNDEAWASRMMIEMERRANRKKQRRMVWNITKYAAIVVLLLVNGALLFLPTTTEEELTYTTIEVPKGQRISMTLEDGTEAWLSPRSVLRIPNQFNKKDRVVELNGEGYFSVTKNSEKPFVVQTAHHHIKVLGTRFNVFAYSQSTRFETNLMEGKVEVFNRESPTDIVRLAPGERVSLVENQLVKSIYDFSNAEYLKSGIFSFTNKPFEEILEYLTLWYDVKFDIHDSVKKELLVSGKFRQSDEIKNILKALQGVHAFQYKEINEQYIEIY